MFRGERKGALGQNGLIHKFVIFFFCYFEDSDIASYPHDNSVAFQL